MTSRDRRATAETTLKTPPDTVILRAGGMRGDLKPGTAVRDEASASLGSMKMPDFRTFGIIGLRAFSRESEMSGLTRGHRWRLASGFASIACGFSFGFEKP
jgi:hypothetical protein